MTLTISPSLISTLATSQSSGVSSMSGMDGNDFMLLLLAQLQNQNPLEPLNDRDMMTQFTQLVSLQELQKISAALQNLDQGNPLAEATGLIGKTVEYVSEQGETVTGLVTGVSLVNDEIMLWLDEQQVPLSAVLSVHETESDVAQCNDLQ